MCRPGLSGDRCEVRKYYKHALQTGWLSRNKSETGKLKKKLHKENLYMY